MLIADVIVVNYEVQKQNLIPLISKKDDVISEKHYKFI